MMVSALRFGDRFGCEEKKGRKENEEKEIVESFSGSEA